MKYYKAEFAIYAMHADLMRWQVEGEIWKNDV